MPRYRTISCDHCGFMQLKRDETCERCGRMTARQKKKVVVNLIYLAFMVLVLSGFYFYIQGLGPKLMQ